jgi:hypothetical protein
MGEKIMKKLMTAVAVMVFGLSAFVIPAMADQPFMRAALVNLDKADDYLKKANADKGGFRVKAREWVAKAETAVKNGIAYDQQTPGGRGRRNTENEKQIFGESRMTQADNENMINARAQLQAALSNLQKASADKGGYREVAMNNVRAAIQAINDGIEYDRTH